MALYRCRLSSNLHSRSSLPPRYNSVDFPHTSPVTHDVQYGIHHSKKRTRLESVSVLQHQTNEMKLALAHKQRWIPVTCMHPSHTKITVHQSVDTLIILALASHYKRHLSPFTSSPSSSVSFLLPCLGLSSLLNLRPSPTGRCSSCHQGCSSPARFTAPEIAACSYVEHSL